MASKFIFDLRCVSLDWLKDLSFSGVKFPITYDQRKTISFMNEMNIDATLKEVENFLNEPLTKDYFKKIWFDLNDLTYFEFEREYDDLRRCGCSMLGPFATKQDIKLHDEIDKKRAEMRRSFQYGQKYFPFKRDCIRPFTNAVWRLTYETNDKGENILLIYLY